VKRGPEILKGERLERKDDFASAASKFGRKVLGGEFWPASPPRPTVTPAHRAVAASSTGGVRHSKRHRDGRPPAAVIEAWHCSDRARLLWMSFYIPKPQPPFGTPVIAARDAAVGVATWGRRMRSQRAGARMCHRSPVAIVAPPPPCDRGAGERARRDDARQRSDT
jgi:hypothetical protein